MSASLIIELCALATEAVSVGISSINLQTSVQECCNSSYLTNNVII